MDVRLRELERQAACGDETAKKRLKQLIDKLGADCPREILEKFLCCCDISTLIAVGCQCGGI